MRQNRLVTELANIYGTEAAGALEERLRDVIANYAGRIPTLRSGDLTEADAILITYGDQVQQEGQPHLQTLAAFAEAHLHGLVSGIHILPFYPWSSDDGFSVMDYRSVDGALGAWGDVERLGRSFRLMFDAVINHASARGAWFRAFLRDEPPYRDYFFTVRGNPDLSAVVRPRTLPLLTEFETSAGARRVWTTFSADQVDLDYRNPAVLMDVIDVLLGYAARGAQFIRLDAIAYLWKEIGTSCIHLPQTHAVIRLFRAVFDEVAPHVRLITETNVPHQENISYFGDGQNEAQLVYNFALPPLVLHTLHCGDASILSEWASGLNPPSQYTTFFNYLASHDGIGLNPVRGILSEADAEALIARTLAYGGQISEKQNPDGSRSAYEMNINYFDALSDPGGKEPLAMQAARFMAAQAIMLSLPGVPGIYFHSLFGLRGWPEGVRLSGAKRAINRRKFALETLEAALADPDSCPAQVFSRYRELLQRRAASPAFHPNGEWKVLEYDGGVFAIQRDSPDGKTRLHCLQNVTARPQQAGGVRLEPYETRWMEVDPTG